MNSILDILKIIEIVFGVLLSIVILVQPKKSSLNLTTFGNEGGGKFERRGPEKTLHNLTIGLSALFIITSLAYFFVA
ncbi:MAG: preprotein translocase subunit SecG [Candidatus Gracilibacteria bacterium]|nr:preprotein translocase subunit SecG [Candidatus Gracilibacteria bacterium]MDD2909231.1 preprotein translocase subunit SecG [Candidatus Gracilibacteria bacterium]